MYQIITIEEEQEIRVCFDWDNGPNREPNTAECNAQYEKAVELADAKRWKVWDPDDESGDLVVSPEPIEAGPEFLDFSWPGNKIYP